MKLTDDEMKGAIAFSRNEFTFEREQGHWNCSMGELKYTLPMETFDDVVGLRLWMKVLTGKDDMQNYNGIEALRELLYYGIIERIGYEGYDAARGVEIDNVDYLTKFKAMLFADKITKKASEMRGMP